MAVGGDAGRALGDGAGDDNIILNPEFDDGLDNWTGSGCKIELHDSLDDGKVLPVNGKYFVAATGRTDTWNGVQQDVTARLQRKLLYEATATVRLSAGAGSGGGAVQPCEVRATLGVQTADGRQQYLGVGKSQASDKEWVQLQGKILLNSTVAKAAIYIEGPPAGVDLLLDSLVMKHAQKAPPAPAPDFENLEYGANIIQNSNLDDGLDGWFPLGPCTLAIHDGAPRVLPPMAQESLALDDDPLNGKHIHVTNRTQTWMGPAQIITDKLTLYATYQVSAWVRVGGQMNGAPQCINVAVTVDSQWINGGQVLARDERWYEVGGSFRVEAKPANRVMVYVQGPDASVDLMVAGLQVFPVDRKARVKHLKKLTDKVRKRDVVLKLTGADGATVKEADGVEVRVHQVSNSFPLGSCIMRTNMDNEDFVDFFTKNFNWAVFGNELKWYWTEPQRGQLYYNDADDLLRLCSDHGMSVRGHCIFWEVDNAVQQWVKTLSTDDLSAAVKSRLNGLLTRYKGKFKHYDVNNEMLHGSFYQDKLGKDIRATMFKTASELDPDALLFVNDYNVESMCDIRATPEAYIEQIIGLQEQGAPVGGVGLQGHVSNPVGPVVRAVLDRLAVLGLPLWFTELDVSCANEHVRADDLEVMLREAYAHPAVEGVMLWGFWELFMSRDDAHLVDAEGQINEAGRRLLQLKREWLTHTHGHADENGEFKFRGHHGEYHVDVTTPTGKVSQTFTVDKDDAPMVLNIKV
ncbi:endo-1,4-beta-xylanase 1-like [Phragmites australis]|uniref:endo-1,4-beta-xylanase 1-like n=1 Tax=Phragmites australis TaxID=29695 RepID=UPI002D77484D|nr:endo-1,4-beta-xylanase 1-like [Phragmites australis]